MLRELPLLLGELLGALLNAELLFVFMGALDEPDGSLMLLPLELGELLVDVPWSLPLQPTNNAATLAIANSFFIMVNFLLQPFHRVATCSIGKML